MKKRKRLVRSAVCSVLAFTMLMGMAQPSFADETEPASSDAADEEVVIESGSPEKADGSGDADASSSQDDEPSSKESEETEAEADYGLYSGDDGSDSMDDPEKAGSSVGWDEKDVSDIQTYSSISGSSGLWWIDDYYVGESDPYDVYMTDDFSLKYQVEFHASEDLSAGTVEMVIDATLGTYRSGKNIIPTDIGIPYGTPDDYTESTSSPFNYYYIDSSGNILTESEAKTADGVRIIIWNYRDIESGSDAMFQVLYKSLDVMQICDMTQWSLEVSASVDLVVDGKETTETVDGNTLTGTVDTQATLTSVTKKAYTASGVSYTPELYTETQVKSYISGSIPEPYASSFSDYIYIVWKVTLKGSATQAYSITVDDTTFSDSTGNGSIVGFKNSSSTGSCTVASGSSPSITYSSSTARSISAEFYVVTAYDADTYETDTAIENDVTVTVHPADGYDEDTTKSASASTTWGEYEWQYLGDTIGIKKYADTTGTKTNKTYRAYETLYEINTANGEDTGEFTFHTKSTDRGYSFTHHVDGSGIGDYIEGTYYTTTTVDDALYIYPNGGTTPSRMLTKDDYYFSSVKAVTTDNGYDVWEDTTAGAAACDDVDRDVYVYAMYYEQGPDADQDGWEYVGKTAFSTGGTMTYTFSESDLERQPYRVKAVHSTINYATYCTITLGVTLRGDSPTIAGIMDEYGDSLTSLKIENLSGVAGRAYGQDDRSETVYVNGELYHDGDYFQDTRVENGNYSEKDTVTGVTLEDFTRDLYGTILMRDNSYSTLTRLEETAAAYKSVTTENDTANSRVLADYTLTAYEAYYVTGSSTCDALRNAGISLPARNDVSYYDLLPYGMRFNANAAVTAGRISAMNSSGTWKTNSGAWDKTGVTVTVDESDVIANWNNTGREMVIFHIHYDGDDASVFYDVPSSDDDLWYQGFGVAFRTYYDWANMDTVDAEYNIAAYVAENVTDESRQLLGKHDSDVWEDDGSASLSSRYEPFTGVSDLNGDGTTELYTNMYCSVSTTTGMATSSTDNITKKVRADDDAVAEYGTTAAVGNGRGYTYEISLKNGTGGILSDIVIFDRLEYSVEDGRNGVETRSGSVFSGLADEDINNHWTGTFNGLTMTALDDLGIGYTIYYNTSRNAKISSEDGTTKPSAVLTSGNGWHTSDSFGGSLSDVKAIAVDLGDFEMDQETSFSFQVHMTAPDGSDCTYAFNNPSYYSVSTDMTGDRTSATDIGDTVRVELGESGTVEVEKEFAEGYEIPAAVAGTKFTYAIMRGDSLLANQEYMVYEYSNGRWVSTGVVSATDINGRFTLRAGEKAVFSDLVDVDSVTVAEVETPLWKVTNEGSERSTGSSGSVSYLFINKYRSPVYLYKTVGTTDLASDEELEEATFTFLIEVDRKGDGSYEPLADSEILYVDKAVTDGSSPAVLKKGTTDPEGKIAIGIGDIIAFFPEDSEGNTIGVSYRITEVGSGESWICENDTVSGTTSDYGAKATVTNYYRYRALIITKDLSDYDLDIDSCEYEWTFRITDSNGSPVTGSSWYMIDSDNNYTGTGGTLDSNGEFTVSGAGSGHRIVVTGLVMNEKYTVTETAYDEELFETVNGGTASVTMPSYSITRKSTITNEYLLRDLKVQKIVLSEDPDADVSSAEFTYTLTDGDGRTVAGAEYTIENGDGTVYSTDGSGRFTLHGGRTAVFDDIGYVGDVFIVSEQADGTYSQIFPADNADGEAALDNDGGKILFINGDFEDVISLTKTLNGLDEAGEAYSDIVRSGSHSGTLIGSTSEDDNDTGNTVPYAVKIWGIYVDEYSEDEGKTSGIASLTFGPALGADHLDSYISCDSDTCIHKLSWNEIIYYAEKYAGNEPMLRKLFGSCLENGCTKAVELTPNDTLFNMTTVDNMLAKGYSGDGVSCLSSLVNTSSWNYSYIVYSDSDPANIYSRSRIRTTLNGDSTNIDARIEAGGTNYYYSDDYSLPDESSCLLSCFPAGLKAAIVSRVIDNTGSPASGSYKGYDTTTTYDRLWLPSMKEVGLDYSYDDGAGSDYGIASSSSERVAYEFSSTAASASSHCLWWSRSRYSDSLTHVCYVHTSGSAKSNYVYYGNALAPGFCIGGAGTSYTVDATIGIYSTDGSPVTEDAGLLGSYDGSADYALILITSDGEVSLYNYNGGLLDLTLYPYDYVYIAGLSNGETVRLTESDRYSRITYETTGDVSERIGTDEIISTGDVMSGSARSGGSITLINDISSAHKESEIYKLMSDSSDEVMTGSRITFRVEIYDVSSGTWSPASGIKYITMDGYHGDYDTSGCYATSSVLTTGSDGKIVLTKSDDGYPYIRFTEDEVYANVYDDARDGTLRIVEVSSGTDGEWGIILGYDGDGWINGPALDVVYGDTIVDADDSSMMFEVEKIAEGGDDDDGFTFTLVHVISAAASPVTSIEDVNDSEAGSNIYYIIYDSETDSRIGDGYTDSNGRFTLESGRYARFFVPDGTVWLVYEGIRTGYVLADVIANSEEAGNASIIDGTTGAVQDATDAQATGRITLTLTDSETGEALSGATFDLYKNGSILVSSLVTDENGRIIVSSLTDGEYYFMQAEASDGYSLPDNVRTDSIVIEDLTRPQDYEINFSNEEDKVAVKYAVKIWGIYTDEYSEDEGATSDIASLTFGPALGANHLDSYISCSSDTCIHKLSWDEIIRLCKDNHGNRTALESLFGSCLENGCTKAVELAPNDTLFDMTTVDNMLAKGYSGDGVSCLYYLLKYDGSNSSYSNGIAWNYSYSGYSTSDPANIYSRSRIRTTLNGDSTNIDAQILAEGTNYYYSDSYPLLDESSCLLSCFPAGLKDAIVSRVIDNTGSPTSGSYKGYDTATTYDRLWLPSMKEVGFNYEYDDGAGSDYGIASSSSERIAYEFNDTAASASSSRSWWSRSRISNSLRYACYVNTSGSRSSNNVDNSYGLAPGFSIY